MHTWAAITNALSWNMVSEQWTYIIKRISRNRVNQSHVANEANNQLINLEISYVGPPPKPNSFSYELIPWISIIWNYGIWSTLVSKHFKIKRSMKKMKRLAKEENGNQNFIKSGTLAPKGAFGMNSLGWFEIIWESEFIKLFTKWSPGNSFSRLENGKWEEMTRDSSVACQRVTMRWRTSGNGMMEN